MAREAQTPVKKVRVVVKAKVAPGKFDKETKLIHKLVEKLHGLRKSANAQTPKQKQAVKKESSLKFQMTGPKGKKKVDFEDGTKAKDPKKRIEKDDASAIKVKMEK